LAIAQARGALAAAIDSAVEADALTGAVIAIMALGRAGADAQMIAHIAASAKARLGMPNQTIKNIN
jgi:hypothetical protein